MMIKARIDIYSHFFKVTKLHPSLYPIMINIAQELTEVSFVKIRGRRMMDKKKVYAARSADGSERRFHINYLPRFLQYLKVSGVNTAELEFVNHELYEPVDAEIEMDKNFQLRDYQVPRVEYVMDEGESKLITMATGFGKALVYGTNVRVPGGWKKIEKLQLGDIISTPCGDTTTVTGIFDHKDKPCYKITFEDGRIAVCDVDHLWMLDCPFKPLEVVSMAEIIKRYQKKQPMFIPLVSKEKSPENTYRDLDIEDARYCFEVTNGYLNDFIFLWSMKTRLELYSNIYFYHGTNEYRISRKRSGKYPEGQHHFITSELNSNHYTFIKLCYSLGYKAKIEEIQGYRGIKYDIVVETKARRLRIAKIEEVGKRDTRCIKIDHPEHLFIIDDHIVTHNTQTSLKAAEMIGKRIFIIVLARYIEKWKEDVINAYGKDCGLRVVKSLSDLIQLGIHAKETGEAPNITLVSTTTMQNYIKEWKQHGGKQIEGMVPPEQLYEVMGIGFRLIDEAHQHFHANFLFDLYMHCPKAVYLTATLDTHDRFQNYAYNLMWPQTMRDEQLKPVAYDETYAILYNHNNPDKIRCKGQQGYSHILYEQSIWRHVPSRCQYLDLIGDQVERFFLPIYKKGRKMLIFCSLVDTCIAVADYLSKRFADHQWQISKFTAGDPKVIIDTNDITVSTLGKAGTALDIDGLVVCLMTTALAEPKANKQAKGRNRDLSKKPGFEEIVPKFIYLVGQDLKKPYFYHQQKKQLFKPITKAIYENQSGYTIGEPLKDYLNRYGKSGHLRWWDVKVN